MDGRGQWGYSNATATRGPSSTTSPSRILDDDSGVTPTSARRANSAGASKLIRLGGRTNVTEKTPWCPLAARRQDKDHERAAARTLSML